MDRIKVNIKEILIFCGFTIFTLFLTALPYCLFLLPMKINEDDIMFDILYIAFILLPPTLLCLGVYSYGRTIKNNVKTSIYIKKMVMCFILAVVIGIILSAYCYNYYLKYNDADIDVFMASCVIGSNTILPALIIAIIYLVLFFENKYRERKEKKRVSQRGEKP